MSDRRLYTGGCQCGAVRYRVEGDLADPHLCHCRMCQKATGNYFMPVATTPREKLTLTRGVPAWFVSSAVARRGFCAACGTPLFYDMPGEAIIGLVLGALDAPDAVRPVRQSGMESRLAWFDHLPALAGDNSNADSADGEARVGAIVESNRQHPDHDTDHWSLPPFSSKP
ncbi:aldehyde-activating protein [Rhizobium rhizosphaerae]|uniref:Aldehyde-activating protein n=1 Tax=Xaviernesmea rhizosphaerae TaxID=1672749 RepID=A0ABX3PB36_9HYPH|nr:GFA family protein [Xaviernesmea rhizosphaerae]OQP85666.1 aldehyde-activating protein [Xaviernesmea rhizosphaerae]